MTTQNFWPDMTTRTLSTSTDSGNSQPVTSNSSDASDWRALYPFASNHFDVGGFKLHYIREGDSSADPVLMVHGNPTWSFYYRGLVNRLSSSHDAIAVDHLGCGLSDKPTDYDYTLTGHRDNLCRLIDHLDLNRITLVAHDWGGAIGLATLLARRERFKRIVLFNTAAFPPPYIPLRIRACRWPLVGKLGVQGFNMFARAATRMATEQKGGLPTAVSAGMLAPYDNWANRTAIYRFVKDIPAHRSHPCWNVLEEIESELPSLADWPILMMWGMRDWCFRPSCLDRFESHWPAAEVHRLEDAGHYVVEDAAAKVEDVVAKFLSETSV